MIIRPNPFREDFQIQFSAHGKFELAVFDILGQLVSKEMIFATGKTEVNRNLGMCTPGTYLIRLSGEGIILSGKVIRLN